MGGGWGGGGGGGGGGRGCVCVPGARVAIVKLFYHRRVDVDPPSESKSCSSDRKPRPSFKIIHPIQGVACNHVANRENGDSRKTFGTDSVASFLV